MGFWRLIRRHLSFVSPLVPKQLSVVLPHLWILVFVNGLAPQFLATMHMFELNMAGRQRAAADIRNVDGNACLYGESLLQVG